MAVVKLLKSRTSKYPYSAKAIYRQVGVVCSLVLLGQALYIFGICYTVSGCYFFPMLKRKQHRQIEVLIWENPVDSLRFFYYNKFHPLNVEFI